MTEAAFDGVARQRFRFGPVETIGTGSNGSPEEPPAMQGRGGR